MGRNSFAFWLIPHCRNGIRCSHGLLMGKGAFVWKVGATLIRPPARPALRGEFLGGLSGPPDPLSYKRTNRSVHTHCVITVRAASALQVGFSHILHIDSRSSDCFQNNGKLIDLVCQGLDRNYWMTWNNIYLTAAVFQLLLSASFQLHFSPLVISMARVCAGLLIKAGRRCGQLPRDEECKISWKVENQFSFSSTWSERLFRKGTLYSSCISQSDYGEILTPFPKETLCKPHWIL